MTTEALERKRQVFFTELDPSAAVKGSRDPLGAVPIWGGFGRHVVGNLTTVTTSVRGFTTMMLGYHFAREVQDSLGNAAESTLAYFLKLEQIAGYARYWVRKDTDLRGIQRVKARLAEKPKQRISARVEDQIQSDQKTYGLWGLYSVASRSSGILEPDGEAISPPARDLLEKLYLRTLEDKGLKGSREIASLLRPRWSDLQLDGKQAGLAKALAEVLGSRYRPEEREFYLEHLACGGPTESTGGLQRQLTGMVQRLPKDAVFDRKALRQLIKLARQKAGGDPLAERLQRIDDLESFLAPARLVFSFLLSRHGSTAKSVGDEIGKAWGKLKAIPRERLKDLEPEISKASGDSKAGGRWTAIALALSDGAHEEVVRLLIDHNALVMRARNGAAGWVRFERGCLDVRFVDETGELCEGGSVPNLWRNNYFLDPLVGIVATLREA